jgi:hypothetical protein
MRSSRRRAPFAALEQRNSVDDRQVHFIKATDTADSGRQIAELVEALVRPMVSFA